jgi:hypothetical protein
MTTFQSAPANDADRSFPNADRVRIVNRASLRFFTSMLAMIVEPSGTDALDALILLLVSSLNVDGVRERAELSERYASLGAPLPENLRRAIPTAEIAEVLRLSLPEAETRTARLAEKGHLTRRGDGWLTAYEGRDPAEFVRLSRMMLALARQFVVDLERQGVHFDAAS